MVVLMGTVYLKASNNNKAETVLGCFAEAVSEYGLPSRVRSDRGGENVKVSEFMLNHVQRGPGRGSMITGKQHALLAQDKQFLLCSLQGFIISKI